MKFYKPVRFSILPLPSIDFAIREHICAMAIHHSVLDLACVAVAVWVGYLALTIRLIVKPLASVLANKNSNLGFSSWSLLPPISEIFLPLYTLMQRF